MDAKIHHSVAVLLLFVLCLIVSSIANQVPFSSVLIQSRSYLLPMLILALAFQSQPRMPSFGSIERQINIIAIILALGAIYEKIFLTRLVHSENRFGDALVFDENLRSASFIGNPIDLANFLMIALIIQFFFIFRTNIATRFRLIALVCTAIGLVLSGSRAPLAASLVVFLGLLFKGRIRGRTIIGLFFLVLFTGAAIVGVLDRVSVISFDYFREDIYRAAFLLDALEIFSDHILIGTGPGTYGGWVSINYSLSPIYKEYGIILLGLFH